MLTRVFASKGPLAGRYFEIPEEDVAAAVAEGGWATELIPGTALYAEMTPADPAWKYPGIYNAEGYVPPDPPEPPANDPVPITSISNANPGVVTVATAEIGRFADGDTVTIAGVPVPADIANGAHAIAAVSAGAGTFELTGVDLSTISGIITDPGMTATPQAPPARSASKGKASEPKAKAEPKAEPKGKAGDDDDERTKRTYSRR